MRRTSVATMKWLVLIAALALLFSGCSDDSRPPDRVSPKPSTLTVPSTPQVPASAKTLIPTPRQVLGHWRVLSVDGQRPPTDANPGLTMSNTGGRYYASWDDGVNEHFREWFLTHGNFRKGAGGSTLVGCIGKPCGQPSGFGVSEAAALRLTSDGRLLFVDAQGAVVAAYGRGGPTMPPAVP